ncbi:PREDICTED: uncharacterized protein LOC109240575 isoform X2 [Nicotiana attenuata]|uniref:Uncharacterized protein n=1 Tax=Nicotiana attenuata TaxID=49451 RepID=A0A314L7P9_NICAT|nr:PREDICTED: uncharacterized protein LOC109240575 isoform X2 [Nicotiana attenuata]OIT37583.1 hypothetical protein A4A49_12793 [Nicotiana attenuata]
MDFHSLTRRALQALCKKNKIPANLTNVAMADALQSLEFVDGIEEILSSCESETANSSMESPGKSEIVTSVPRTCHRATQQKAIKHDLETLQTLTRSRCRTRGKVVRDVDEAKNDMHETPALPTTRRRAAATAVRAKLESAMKECEPKEKIGDRIQGEMKDVPKTPAVLTSQRKELKASSVRQVYSTRRSARIAGKPMQESTQENEMSGTLTFDAFPEETEENLEVDSEQYFIHKNEEVDKNGQCSNTLVQNEIETEDVLQQESNNNLVVVLDTKAEEGSEEVPLGHNNNEELENGKEMASEGMQSLNDVSGAKLEVFGEESMEESEIDQAQAKTEKDFQNKSQNLGEDTKRSSDITNMILMKQPHEEDKPHCDDTSDFVAENDREEEDHLNHTDIAGGQKLMGEPASVNRDSNIDFHDVSSLGQFNGEGEAKVSGSQQCLKDASEANMEDAGEEEPMEEYEVDHAEANVDSAAHGLEVAEEEEPMEESEVDYAEANVDNAAHGVPHLASLIPDDAAQEGECEVKVRGSQQCLHVSEVVAGEEPMEESEIDHAAIKVDIAAHALPPQASLIPNAIPEPVYKGIAGNDSKQSLQDLSLRKLTKMLHVSEVVAGEEPMEESEIDHAAVKVDIAAHALAPQASLIPNAIPEPVYKGIAGNESKQSLQDLSLRQLTKMLKERHKRS